LPKIIFKHKQPSVNTVQINERDDLLFRAKKIGRIDLKRIFRVIRCLMTEIRPSKNNHGRSPINGLAWSDALTFTASLEKLMLMKTMQVAAVIAN